MVGRTDMVLIHPPYHRRLGSGRVFPLGLGYLASAAEDRGFTVEIIDCPIRFASLRQSNMDQLAAWLADKLTAIRPGLAIGIGPCTTSAVRGIEQVARTCKDALPDVPLVYGGPLASVPEQSRLFFEQFYATAVVPGDGEHAICGILEELSNGRDLSRLDNVTTQDHVAPNTVIPDLDTLAFPRRKRDEEGEGYVLSVRRDLFAGEFATIVTSRGCPHRCGFCLSGQMRDGVFNRRSVDNIVEEIGDLQRSHNVNTIVFYDDTFFPSPRTLTHDIAELAGGIARLDRKPVWQIEAHPAILGAFDRKSAAMLFEAGCRQLNIGIEKANPATADQIGKRVDIDQVKAAVGEIRAGAPRLRLTGTFILGGPQEDRQSVLDTIDLAQSLGLLFAHFYPLEVYRGTDLYSQCFPEDGPLDWYKRILADDLPWGELIYESALLTRNDLLALAAEGYRSFYGRDAWHGEARRVLGPNYEKVASVVEQWCVDRFAIGEEVN
jgi:anaerobic magnesium-protoporphyrin IX monomethyl ester cyclase